MHVSMEDGRLVIAPADENEAALLARWHSEFQSAENAEVFFRHRNRETAGLDLVLRA